MTPGYGRIHLTNVLSQGTKQVAVKVIVGDVRFDNKFDVLLGLDRLKASNPKIDFVSGEFSRTIDLRDSERYSSWRPAPPQSSVTVRQPVSKAVSTFAYQPPCYHGTSGSSSCPRPRPRPSFVSDYSTSSHPRIQPSYGQGPRPSVGSSSRDDDYDAQCRRIMDAIDRIFECARR